MDDQPDLVETRIQLSEARTDTKFAHLIGELHVSNARLEAKFDALAASQDEMRREMRRFQDEMHGLQVETRGFQDETRRSFDEMRTVMRSWGQWTIGIVLAVGIGTIGTLIGLLAFGQGEFGRGLNVHDVVESAIAHHLEFNQPPKP